MDYDWEKIFKDKTNKELYEIYSGKTLLPNETVKYAKQELESRNFDFENMTENKAAWKLSDLLFEEENASSVIKENEAKIIKYKELPIIIAIIVILYFSFSILTNASIPILYLFLSIAAIIFTVLLTNFQFKKQNQNQIKRLERINKLKETIEKNVPPNKRNPIQKDIERNVVEYNKSRKLLIYITGAIIITFLLISLINTIV